MNDGSGIKAKKHIDHSYYHSMLSFPVDKHIILLEAGQGNHGNGNSFAFACELSENPKYSDFVLYFTVTKASSQSIKEKFRIYGLEKIRTVIKDSLEYQKILATAGYLINDNTFPIYFIKRKEQIYLNTWHGTPLKCLGRADIEHSASIGNVQKNFYACDYCLFPNPHTRDIFFRDYMMEMCYSGKILMADYPRNHFLTCPSRIGAAVRKAHGLEGKTLAAYMPTWRRINDPALQAEYNEAFVNNLRQLDPLIGDDMCLLVNLHFFDGQKIDYSSFTHIRPFPEGCEPYDVLSYCDILVTDYSSVIFDYAVLNRKIVIFAGDEEEYKNSTGLYFSLESLDLPITKDARALAEELKERSPNISRNFSKKFLTGRAEAQPSEILDSVLFNEGLEAEQINLVSVRKNVLYYIYSIRKPSCQKLFTDALERTDHNTENPVLVFNEEIDAVTGSFLRKLPENACFIRVPLFRKELLDPKLIFGILFYKITGNFTSFMRKYYSFEEQRTASGWKPDEIRFLSEKRTRLKGLLKYIHEKQY